MWAHCGWRDGDLSQRQNHIWIKERQQSLHVVYEHDRHTQKWCKTKNKLCRVEPWYNAPYIASPGQNEEYSLLQKKWNIWKKTLIQNLVKANAFGLSLDPFLYHGSTVYTVEQWNRSVWVLWKLLLVTIVLWRTCRYYAVLQISWLVSFSDHIIYNTNRLPMEGKKDKKHVQSYTTCFCTYLYYKQWLNKAKYDIKNADQSCS